VPKRYVPAAPVADVPPGTVKTVRVGSTSVALCNVSGRLYAVADACTHDGAAFGQAGLDGVEITCPRHGAAFDVTTGAVTRLPAAVPVKTFDTRIRSGHIEVEVEVD